MAHLMPSKCFDLCVSETQTIAHTPKHPLTQNSCWSGHNFRKAQVFCIIYQLSGRAQNFIAYFAAYAVLICPTRMLCVHTTQHLKDQNLKKNSPVKLPDWEISCTQSYSLWVCM